MAEWLLVFWFAGRSVEASGPHEAQTCLVMLAAQPGPAKCVHKDDPRRVLGQKGGPRG